MMIDKLIGDLKNQGLEMELAINKYYAVISKIQRRIHDEIPEENYDTTKAAAPTSFREEIFNGVNYKRAVIFLLSRGCEWALSSGHGCTMCGHLGKQTRKHTVIPAEDFVRQFDSEFRKIDFNEYPLLNIFNNGSFLNDRELPPYARVEILKKINTAPGIKMLLVESRPEFVTEDKVLELKELLPGKHVEIAIGLELKNDLYRRLCLNKGFSLKNYDKAAGIITKHLYLRTYVFLKPPLLTEEESIAQAVEAVEHAFHRGSTTVSLEACTIQDFTLVKYLYDSGMYKPPWMWSIIETVRRSSKKNKLIIGLFQFYPSPEEIPYNCPQCSETVLEAMRRYNRTLDMSFLDELDCKCKIKWQKELAKTHPPFEKRLEKLIERLNRNLKE